MDLRQGDANGPCGCGVCNMDAALDECTSAVQVQIKALDVTCRRVYEVDIASETAVVPPVRVQSRNAICVASVVDSNDDKVLARTDGLSDVAVERGEPALMRTDLRAVYPGDRCVIGGTDM